MSLLSCLEKGASVSGREGVREKGCPQKKVSGREDVRERGCQGTGYQGERVPGIVRIRGLLFAKFNASH